MAGSICQIFSEAIDLRLCFDYCARFRKLFQESQIEELSLIQKLLNLKSGYFERGCRVRSCYRLLDKVIKQPVFVLSLVPGNGKNTAIFILSLCSYPALELSLDAALFAITISRTSGAQELFKNSPSPHLAEQHFLTI